MKKPYDPNKINQQALNKTLKQIEKSIVKVLKYYINDVDKKEIKSIMNYLMSDIRDIVTENMKANKKPVRRKFSQQVIDAIVESFQNVDMIKYAYYENNSASTYMNLVVVHDHDDDKYATDTIYGIIENDLDFKNLIIEAAVYHESELFLDSDSLKGCTTIFSRYDE